VAKFLKDYALSLVLAGLFLVSWILHALTGWVGFVADQQEHGQVAELCGASGYIWRWFEGTFENWQSEFLQLFTMVVLTAFLIHRGSHESRDSQAELRAAILHIEQQLEEMRGSERSDDHQPDRETRKKAAEKRGEK
jgi:hypothetical protein